MAGLVPAIHVLFRMRGTKDVDARDKPGHDGKGENVDARDIGANTPLPPACGGGRRARRARRVGEISLQLARCDTPTPALPRKRERGTSSP